jgi:CHAT domain-containing protein
MKFLSCSLFLRSLQSRFIRWFLVGFLVMITVPIVSFYAPGTIASGFPHDSLNARAEQQLQRGQPTAALATWQLAEQHYRQGKDQQGVIGSQINQARALQAAGFYRRAKTLLEQVEKELATQSDQSLQVIGLVNLGNVLRIVGDGQASQAVLQRALAIAQTLPDPASAQTVAFHLANTLRQQQDNDPAIALYQQAAADSSPLQLQARLNLLDLFLVLNQVALAETLMPHIQTQLAALPPSQLSIYGRIELAESLLRQRAEVGERQRAEGGEQKADQNSKFKIQNSKFLSAAELLSGAVREAKSLGDRRGESYALGRLGAVYESTQQWQAAEQLTRRAWDLAQSQQAMDIAYQWRWQLGRLRWVQGDPEGAIAHYTQAFKILQSLRFDLIAINTDVQFSFREQIEPLYRELVDLLLHSEKTKKTEEHNSAHLHGSSSSLPQPRLQQARQVIESLQLAELNNFFREACLDAKPQQIDEIDPTAAVIYPIILPNSLEVILALPGQPLLHYHVHKSQADLEQTIHLARNSLRSTAFASEYLALAAQLYDWLIRPAAPALVQHQIQTLVFVLDGSLRGLPMAFLHDGDRYLVEQYRISVAPGLQLLASHSSDRVGSALVAGLSEENQGFAAMPAVEAEVNQIQRLLSARTLLNQTFTRDNLQRQLNERSFPIVHLATHGQFSSSADQTFLLTWNDRITVHELDTLIRTRDVNRLQPIELLILSACETATGDNRAALGMAGIALRSGARSTLATLWLINDGSTAIFMAALYHQLTVAHVPKAEAVRQAQLQLLANPQFQHPFYWAPFVLIGNWT